MTNYVLHASDKPEEGTGKKIGSTICGVCIYVWAITGLIVIVGMVSKLAGLI